MQNLSSAKLMLRRLSGCTLGVAAALGVARAERAPPKYDPLVALDVAAAAREPSKPWGELSLAEIRAGCVSGLADLSRGDTALQWSQRATVRACHTTSPEGAAEEPDLPLRIYRPKDADKHARLPLIMFFHGGGFAICDPIANFDYACKRLAAQTGCVVLSVQYRQAPENRFPTAPEDCYRALQWAAAHAEDQLGADSSRIATAGDSAGGNLAAVVPLISRDRGGPPVGLQICLCPVTDWASLDTPSYRRSSPERTPHLHTDHMRWYKRRYLRPDVPADALHPYASPVREADLSSLPGLAIVVNAEHDPLCSEGEAYANKLRAAGKLMRSTTTLGVMHDFYLRMEYEKSDQFWAELARDVKTWAAGEAKAIAPAVGHTELVTWTQVDD